MKINDDNHKRDMNEELELDAHAQKLESVYAAAEKRVEGQPPKDRRPKRRKGRGLLIVLIVILALLAGLFVAYKLWRKPPEVQQGAIHTPNVEPDQQVGDEMAADPEPTPVQSVTTEKPGGATYNENGRKDGTYTFLVIGSDNGFGNTDTIIYGVLDTVDHTLNVVNIPRDTQVNVPWSIKRINSVYAYSDNNIAGLRQEVGHLVGYNIDETYAIIDMEAFVKIVDCIGGVDYEVPFDMYDYIPDQDFLIDLKQGYQHLDGQDALELVRFRSGYLNADLGRINTQQDFLMTVARQLLRLKNIPNLPQLLSIVEEYVETNLTASNIAFFVEEFLKIDSEDIHFYTLPGEGQMVKGGAYYFVLSDQWVPIVNQGLNPFNVELSAANMNYLVYKNGDVYTSAGAYYGTESFLDYDAYIQSLQNPS
ncbi:MAG: LCP family protein [Oscillospiraceae bacterium]|nr:LCP family protein [Oscillospiraceae bacterium]